MIWLIRILIVPFIGAVRAVAVDEAGFDPAFKLRDVRSTTAAQSKMMIFS
jgi:hypothetical protein